MTVKTNKRYFERIAKPTAIAGVVAIIGVLLYYSTFSDNEAQTDTSALAANDPSYQAVGDVVSSDYSPEAVATETSALHTVLANLQVASAKYGGQTESEETVKLRKEALTTIKKLGDADASNWEERKQEAYDVLQTYAAAVDETIDVTDK